MNRLEKTAILSALATAVIAVVKFAAGTAFGSIALVADAIHSFTDIIGSIAVFFGVRFSEIKSKQFPYGLYKLENLVSLFLSLLIFYTAFEILMEATAGLGEPGQQAGSLTIAAALFSLVVSFLLARYKKKVGEEEGSPSMISEAKHTQMDAITTLGVLFAVSASFLGYPIFDPLIGLVVALLVFKAGAEIFLDSAKVLLDVSLDHKTIKKMENVIAEFKELKSKEVLARSSGRYIFVDLFLETKLTDLKRVNQLRQQVQEKIMEAVPRIDKITIEIEYKKKEVLVYAVPLDGKNEKANIVPGFGLAKYFGLIKASNKPQKKNKVLSKKFIKNPHALAEARRGILAAQLLAKNKADVLYVQEDLKKGGAFYALQDYFIEIRKTEKKAFKQLVKEIES